MAKRLSHRPFVYDEDRDYRDDCLRLDTGSVTVSHVGGVTFHAESHRVRRHRTEKRELPF